MSGELVTIQAAASAVSAVASATSTILAQWRLSGVVRAEQRETLRIALLEIRAERVQATIRRIAAQNMDDVCMLYDYAEDKRQSAGYFRCLEQADLANRLLLENLQQFARQANR